MKKRKKAFYEIIIALFIAACILLPRLIGTKEVYGTSSYTDQNGYPTTDKSYEDLEAPGTKFGVVTGSDWVFGIEERYPQGEIVQFNSMSDIYTAIENDKIDAGMAFLDEQASMFETHPGVAFIKEPFSTLDFGFATQKTEKGAALCRELNAYLKTLRESGEFDRLCQKWQNPDREGDVMGSYTFSGEKGSLKVSADGLWTPMNFFVGDKLTGLFIEIINGFCAESGYIPEFETVEYSSEISGLISGQYDILADAVLITEERQKSVNITDGLMSDTDYLVVKADSAYIKVSKFSLFINNLKESFRRTFITENRYKILLSGLGITVALSFIAGFFGTILGGIICFLRLRKNPWAEAFASLYIRLFRGIPIVVLLLVLYYIVFNKSSLSAFWVCAIGFSIDFSAYSSEIFRSGIEAVPAGQTRAARALGFNSINTFRKVVLPQALVHILPVYSGQFIATVKMTSVAGYISVIDLTKAANIIQARTFDAFFPLFATTLIYLILSAFLVVLLRFLEKNIIPAGRSVDKRILKAVENFKPETADFESVRNQDRKQYVRTDQTPLLEADHLRKSFGKVSPIKDVSFNVYEEDVIAIIGPSGTGKSTLLYLLNQLEKADGGRITFVGEDTLKKGYNVNEMRKKVGMVFQSFNLFSHLTIIENLILAQTELLDRSLEEACDNAMSLLQKVGLADKALNFPDQLSGGQKQRIAIARTVAMDPHIIFFDEPTSALDPTMVGEVLAVIKSLSRQRMTMLIVTHEMHFAREVANRVFFMDEGIIYEEGRPDQIFDAPQKDKTRQFIRQLKVLPIQMKAADFDYPSLVTRIEQFGFHHMISRKLVYEMQTITEELCLASILPSMKSSDQIGIVFEYNENGNMNMTITYDGEDKNPLEEADPLSLNLIRHACREIVYQYEQNSCCLKVKF